MRNFAPNFHKVTGKTLTSYGVKGLITWALPTLGTGPKEYFHFDQMANSSEFGGEPFFFFKTSQLWRTFHTFWRLTTLWHTGGPKSLCGLITSALLWTGSPQKLVAFFTFKSLSRRS